MKLRLVTLSCCIFHALSCGYHENEVDRVMLDPGQVRTYSFETEDSIEIGILLAREVDGGVVELQQVGSDSIAGTSHLYVSRDWAPIEGKIELELVNKSVSSIEVVVFRGGEPDL